MKWYTAIGCKMEDDEGRLLVKIGGQEKVLTEMEEAMVAAKPAAQKKEEPEQLSLFNLGA